MQLAFSRITSNNKPWEVENRLAVWWGGGLEACDLDRIICMGALMDRYHQASGLARYEYGIILVHLQLSATAIFMHFLSRWHHHRRHIVDAWRHSCHPASQPASQPASPSLLWPASDPVTSDPPPARPARPAVSCRTSSIAGFCGGGQLGADAFLNPSLCASRPIGATCSAPSSSLHYCTCGR